MLGRDKEPKTERKRERGKVRERHSVLHAGVWVLEESVNGHHTCSTETLNSETEEKHLLFFLLFFHDQKRENDLYCVS